MSPERSFGQIVRELRLSLNLSQEELAEATGCSRQFISLLENGRNSPSLTTLIHLAAALKVKPAELILRLQERLELEGRPPQR